MRRKVFCFSYFLLLLCGLWGCQKGFEAFDAQLIYNKAQRLHDEGQLDRAIGVYQLLLDTDYQNKEGPDKANIHYDLGMAYLDQGKQAKAAEQIRILKDMKRDDLAHELEGALKDVQTLSGPNDR